MAEKVAEWPQKYNCDGIDLDLEDGAGNRFLFLIDRCSLNEMAALVLF